MTKVSQKSLLLLAIVGILLLGITSVWYVKRTNTLSFEECSAQYGATKSYPGTCTTPDGKVIVQPIK